MSDSLHEQHMGRGVTFAVLAAACFSAMSLFGKIIGNRASTDTIVFARFFISLILLTPWILKHPKQVIRVTNLRALVSRSFFSLASFGCFFYALRFIPLSNALLLSNTFALFIPIIVWLTSGHRTPHTVSAGMLLGFIGLGIILKPAPGFFQDASLLGLASGLLGAFAIVLIRQLTKTTPIVTILFYNFVLCSSLTALLLPFHWRPIDPAIWGLLFLVGLCGAIYQLLSTLALAKASARITSPLMFLCIPFGALADWLIWHQVPDALTLTGMGFVILGSTVTIYFGQKHLMKK